MIEDVASLFGGGYGNFQTFLDFILAGEIGKPRGTKRKFERRIGLVEGIQRSDCHVLCFSLSILFCLFWLWSMFYSFSFGFFCNDFDRFENVFGVRIRLENGVFFVHFVASGKSEGTTVKRQAQSGLWRGWPG